MLCEAAPWKSFELKEPRGAALPKTLAFIKRIAEQQAAPAEAATEELKPGAMQTHWTMVPTLSVRAAL